MAGMASPFALAGSVSVNPQAIGSASGMYGFVQMGYGMLCTIVVETWRPGAIYPVATVLLVILAQNPSSLRSSCHTTGTAGWSTSFA